MITPNSNYVRPMSRSLFLSLLLAIALPQTTLAQLPAVPQISRTTPAPTISAPIAPATDTNLRAGDPSSAYILDAGDQITITVLGYEEYTGAQTVLPDGSITLPVIGSVLAAGQSPDTLAQDLALRLQRYLIDPAVTVSLGTLRPVVVNVSGQVQRPGPVQLRSVTSSSAANTGGRTEGEGSLDAAPTVSSALAQAGGVTRDADIREVVVTRKIRGREPIIVTLNLWDAIWSENAPQDIVLQAGDTIYVPQLTADAQIDRRLIARSSFSPRTVRVRVVGQVQRPGEIQIPPDSTVSSAVAIAGGPTNDASLSRVKVVRLNEDGSVSNQEVDLRNLQDSYQIQAGDVVIVPEQGTSSFLRGLGRVLSPLGGLLGIFGL
jgi:polysaccharide biosynthesis/export protein